MMQDNVAHAAASMCTDNPLLAAASPLLNTIVQIRLAATHDDPPGLRHQLVEEVRQFENRCKQVGIPFEMIIGTRYCLCSALDEAASQTPWGSRGIWSGSGLLVTFHNESWGGEKFYQLLARISQTPQQHLWLLEVLHYCLLLGYEGRYRTQDNGRTLRDGVRQRLALLIEQTRGASPPSLSPPVADRPRQSPLWRPPVPLWVCLALAALVASLFYTAFNWRLSQHAAPLLSAIYRMPLPAESSQGRHPASPQALLDLHQRLKDLISDRQLDVSDGTSGSRVIIAADTLFAADGASLTTAGRSLIARIAVAMESIHGSILVTAWSDDRPPRNDRFPTAYEYTQAQAHSVAAVLHQVMTQNSHTVRAEGRGDSIPLMPNDSDENRARNRRIEITLSPGPETGADPTSRSIP